MFTQLTAVDGKLVDFVQERMDKVEKYYDKVVSADVYLKLRRQVIKKIRLLGKDECPWR
jgi:putative sigma-54 modulation protein